MRLRLVALVTRELEQSVEDLCGVLGIEVAYNDPKMVAFGLVNAVMPVGDTFLEVVSPAQEQTTAGAPFPFPSPDPPRIPYSRRQIMA